MGGVLDRLSDGVDYAIKEISDAQKNISSGVSNAKETVLKKINGEKTERKKRENGEKKKIQESEKSERERNNVMNIFLYGNISTSSLYDLLKLICNSNKEIKKNRDNFFSEEFLKSIKNDSTLRSILENTYKEYGHSRFSSGYVNNIGLMIKNKFYDFIGKEIKSKDTDIDKKKRDNENLIQSHSRIIQGIINEDEKFCRRFAIFIDNIDWKGSLKYTKNYIKNKLNNEGEYKKFVDYVCKDSLLFQKIKGNLTTNESKSDILKNNNLQKDICEKFTDWTDPKEETNKLVEEERKSERIQAESKVNNEFIGGMGTKTSSAFKQLGQGMASTLDNLRQREPTLSSIKFSENLISRDPREFLKIFTENLIKVEDPEFFSHKKILEENGHKNIEPECITALIVCEKYPQKLESVFQRDEKSINEIFKMGNKVKQYLIDIEQTKIALQKSSKESSQGIKTRYRQCIENVGEMGKKIQDIFKLKEAIQNEIDSMQIVLNDNFIGMNFVAKNLQKTLENTDIMNKGNIRGIAVMYACLIGSTINIESDEDIDIFINTINGMNTKYTSAYRAFVDKQEERDYEWRFERAVETLTARYERAQEVAENRRFYESDFINFSKTNTDTQNQSGLKIASGIDNIQNKLNHYKIKSNRSEHEDTALRYTAFDTTFNNAFNLNNLTVQNLANLEIDLRSELSNYGIYNPENNSFNKESRNKFVADKLLNSGLTPEEIESLGQTMESLPTEVEKNYEILCGNFDADQDSFEKIAKIYALGEVIDNIKALFSGLASEKLGKFMGLELDKDNPADIIGDCLFIKGKINGTETNIKYDLHTGKIYMNSFTQENYNPPKIIIGNTEPNTEIGDLGSFEDAISKLDSTFPIQNDEEQENDVENRNNSSLSDGNKSEDEDSMKQNRKDSEELIKRKLNHDLKEIGTIVKEKAGEQGQENSIIDDLLKTFNIFPDSGEAKNIEFIGGSDLFTLIESIRNTNNEDDLLEFSSQMKELMSLCGLSRGKNNENPNKSNFNSVTIFDIDESNATTDIISLQKANENFFNTNHGEKDKIKSSESHFDSSIQLSFANIIVQKCCRNTGDGRKISANEMKLFVKSVKDGISDKKDVLAIESMFKSEDIG